MREKTKILQVYYEPAKSGITRHVSLLTRELKQEYDFYVLCSTSDPKIEQTFRSLNIPISIVPPAKYFSLKGLRNITRLVRRERIPLVHIHNLQSIFWCNLPRLFCPRTRFLFTPQVIGFENKFVDTLFYLVWRLFSILTKRIVVLSDEQKDFLMARGIGNEKKILVIPNSIPPFEVDDNMEPVFDENELPIVSVMRLVRQKAPERILEIAGKVCPHFPRARFYIIGDGPLESKLKKIISERRLRERVIMTGFREDALTFVRNAAVILTTSRWEGMPYTLLEAMYLGKPIVASDIHGHRPLVIEGETGYLARSLEQYVDQTALLLNDEILRETLGKNARRHFKNHFAFDDFIQNMKSLYQEVS